jgi:hypothetical protein
MMRGTRADLPGYVRDNEQARTLFMLWKDLPWPVDS